MIKLIGELIINHVKKQMLEINTLQILLCFYSALNNKYDNNWRCFDEYVPVDYVLQNKYRIRMLLMICHMDQEIDKVQLN